MSKVIKVTDGTPGLNDGLKQLDSMLFLIRILGNADEVLNHKETEEAVAEKLAEEGNFEVIKSGLPQPGDLISNGSGRIHYVAGDMFLGDEELKERLLGFDERIAHVVIVRPCKGVEVEVVREEVHQADDENLAELEARMQDEEYRQGQVKLNEECRDGSVAALEAAENLAPFGYRPLGYRRVTVDSLISPGEGQVNRVSEEGVKILERISSLMGQDYLAPHVEPCDFEAPLNYKNQTVSS